MKASELIGELIVLMAAEGDRRVIVLNDNLDPVRRVLFSEDSKDMLGENAPFYLQVDR